MPDQVSLQCIDPGIRLPVRSVPHRSEFSGFVCVCVSGETSTLPVDSLDRRAVISVQNWMIEHLNASSPSRREKEALMVIVLSSKSHFGTGRLGELTTVSVPIQYLCVCVFFLQAQERRKNSGR